MAPISTVFLLLNDSRSLIDTFLELCSDGLELSRLYMNDKGLLWIRF